MAGPQSAILLFGMPRSGTTWIGKIFDSHPQVLYRHEPDTWQRLKDVPLIAGPGQSEELSARLRDYLASMPEIRADRVCGKRPQFPKSYTSRWAVRRYSLASVAHKALGRAGVRTEPPAPPPPAAGAPCRLVWKSIESLGRLGAILEAIDDARAIQIVRHPCGYVASVLRGEAAERFDHNQAAADFPVYEMLSRTPQAVGRGLTLDAFKAMTPVQRLAWRWVIFNEAAQVPSFAHERSRILYYEELCAAPEPVTRALFEFCGLDWNAQTARFVLSSTTTSRDDYYSVFKDPLASAWRWQSELDESDVERIAAIVGECSIGRPYFTASTWNRARHGRFFA